MNRPVTIHSGEKIAQEKGFMGKFRKIVALCDAVLNCRNIKVSDNNLSILGVSSSTAANVSAFAIVSLVEKDYFIARELSNFHMVADTEFATVGDIDIKIAKPPSIRRSVVLELIDGFTITYRDTGSSSVDNNRIANDGSEDESQCVYPRYITLSDLGYSDSVPTHAQCVIYAAETDGAAGVIDEDGAKLDWIEILPARVWAKRFAP